MSKTKKIRLSIVSLLTVICLCFGLGFYGAFLSKSTTGGGYLANSDVQTTAVSDNAMLADGQVPGGSASYKASQNFSGWRAINNATELQDWISNQGGQNAYLNNNIDNFAWSSSDAGTTSIAEGLKLDGCGYTITMTKNTSGSYINANINSGLFAYRLYGDVINTNFVYTGNTLLKKADSVDNYRIGVIFSIINGNFINNSVTFSGTYNYHTDTTGARGWSHGTMGIIAGLSYGTIKNTTVNFDGGSINLHFKNGWVVGIKSSIYMSAFVGFTQDNASIINCTYNRISGTMTCAANDGARYGTAIGSQTGSSRVSGFIYKNTEDFKAGLTTNSDTGIITAVKSGGTIENIYSNKSLSGGWVDGRNQNTGTFNYLSDTNRYDIAFDKTNDNNLIITDKNNTGIFWALNRESGSLDGYTELYKSLLSGAISIPKINTSYTNNNSGLPFDVIMGTRSDATVGYNSGDKVFDGETIGVNNPQGLSLTGSLNPRNAGTHNISVNGEEIINVDGQNLNVVVNAGAKNVTVVNKGTMSLTISRRPITIGLTAVEGLIYNGQEQLGVNSNIENLIANEDLNLIYNVNISEINAGTYNIQVTDYNKNYEITDGQEVSFAIARKDVSLGLSAVTDLIFNGGEQIGILTDIQGELANAPLNLNWNGSDRATNANTYNAILADYNKNYNITDAQSIEYTIAKKNITLGLSAISGMVYNGEEQVGIATDIQGELENAPLNLNWNGSNIAKYANTYTATVVSYNENYNITDAVSIEYNIAKRTVAPVWSEILKYKANGNIQTPFVGWDNAIEADIATALSVTDGASAASYDAYTVTASIVDTVNYIFAENSVTSVEYNIDYLTVTLNSTNHYGNVIIENDKYDYDYNETARINVTTKFGYVVNTMTLNGNAIDVNTREFVITDDADIFLTFGARDVNVNIIAENGSVTASDDFKFNNTVILTATPAGGYAFINWTTPTGVVLSNTSTYTFIAIDSLDLVANFAPITEDGVFYTFLGINNIVMKTVYAGADFDINSVEANVVPGYTFVEWKAVEGQDYTYIAVYAIDETATKKNVTVTGGSTIFGDSEYTYNSVATVQPNGEGVFKYWKDSKGQILSYDAEYRFAVLGDMDIIAVYDEETVNVNTIAVNSVKDNGDKWSFSAGFAVIDGYTLVEAGIMITNNAEIANVNDFVMGSKVMFAKSNKISKYNQFMINANKSDFAEGYARAYMIVNNGVENIILYSNIIVNTANAI